MLKTCQKIIGLVLATTFIAVTLFGMNTGMDMHQDGTMSGCTLDQSVTCSMDYQEHVNQWQQTFTATQPTRNTIATLVVLLMAGGLTLSFFSLLRPRQHPQLMQCVPRNAHRQREITAKLADYILRSLSNGILNPKLYNFSKAVH